MKTVKLFLVNCYQAYNIHAIGHSFTFDMPHDTVYDKYECLNGDGVLYELPDGYSVGEDVTGCKHIYFDNFACSMGCVNDRPIVYNGESKHGIILKQSR